MYRLICAVIVIFVLRDLHLSSVTAYKWVALKAGDSIPEHAVRLKEDSDIFVGRARHYDLILPAEVYNSTHSSARIKHCSTEIVKDQFEVLVSAEDCEWYPFLMDMDVPENIVRAGSTKNGEPIFIGKTEKSIPKQRTWNHYSEYDPDEDLDTSYSVLHIASILLTTKQFIEWENNIGAPYALKCNDGNTWTDTSSVDIPSNTISGGKSEDDHEIFVARLLNDCHIVPGQVIPELGIAAAVFEGKDIYSSFCQVLVGDSTKYRWVAAINGEIPDYAVVGGRYNKTELMYVARVNKTLGYVLHRELLAYRMVYEILVRNAD